MSDSKTVVAQATVVDYISSGYTSDEYTKTITTGNTTVSALPSEPYYTVEDSIIANEITHNSEDLSVIEEDSSVKKYGTQNSVGVSDYSTLGPSQDAGYDYLVNGNAVGEIRANTSNENETVSDVGGDEVANGNHFENDSGPPTTVEEDRLWSVVRANSMDFNAWIALIEETEKTSEGHIFRIRKVYDAFLAEFPLCYGYWKKYADHESHIGSIDKVVEVYERAVQGVTYSMEIWLLYCIFSISTYEDPETIRRLFERGLAYVGTDYLSYPLWDKYIEYEYTHQEWGRLAVIYTRILEHPNQHLDRYFNSFKELAASRPLLELRAPEEVASVPSISLEVHSQEVEEEVLPDGTKHSCKLLSVDSTEAEELEKYISIRERMYKKAKEFDSKIIGFETSIRRPYFHVKPLNVAELENWHNYLDFIETEDDFNKVVKLYERCLIACANYPEYWIRYVLCMEGRGSMDLANNALSRATQLFVKRQPEIHLFAARFKEQNKDIEGARSAYQLVHSEISPGLLEAIVKHANMEHRLGKLEDAFLLFEHAIAIEKGKEQSQVLSMLFAQYSRFLYVISGNVEKAKEILIEAIEYVQLSKPLLEALIHLESILPLPKQIDQLDYLVDKFIVPKPDTPYPASIAEREEISCIFLEFLDLFGDAISIKKADDRHIKFFLPHRSSEELKKRHAEDYLVSDKSKLAKSSAYPNGQNQWPAGYAVQPQAWPQVTQAQPWNSSYPQQSYGGYGSYASSYPHPPVTTPIPQTSAYAAYPSTYPAQAASTQQSYVLPAATTAQQPGSAQIYYGTY